MRLDLEFSEKPEEHNYENFRSCCLNKAFSNQFFQGWTAIPFWVSLAEWQEVYLLPPA